MNSQSSRRAGNFSRYLAMLTQTGENAPTATVLVNELGGDVTFAREDAGIYFVTSVDNLFTSGKTVFTAYNGFDKTIKTQYSTPGEMQIFCTDDGGVEADNLLDGIATFIEIIVYD